MLSSLVRRARFKKKRIIYTQNCAIPWQRQAEIYVPSLALTGAEVGFTVNYKLKQDELKNPREGCVEDTEQPKVLTQDSDMQRMQSMTKFANTPTPDKHKALDPQPEVLTYLGSRKGCHSKPCRRQSAGNTPPAE